MKKIDYLELIKLQIKYSKAYTPYAGNYKIKLDANESPYDPFKLEFFNKKIELNRYPDSSGKELKTLISKEFKVSPDNILLGNGSDEIIYYIIITFGGTVLYPYPTFSMYGIISKVLGEKTMTIPLDNNFDIDLNKIKPYLKKKTNKIIFLSSPNNPTGNCFSYHKILEIIKLSKGIIILDEAYQPFSNQKSFIPLTKKYQNLLVMRTFSKIGLAGIRTGFLIGNKEIIKEINKVRLPYNLNSISQLIAIEGIKNKKLINSYIETIILEREKMFNKLKTLKFIIPYISQANFILFKTKNSNSIFKKLLKTGILIKNTNDVIKDTLRITIGTPKENAIFIKNLIEVKKGDNK